MFYKKVDDYWFTATRVSLPNGEELTENNRENSYSWVWHDNPPQEYLDWLDEQQEEEE